MTFLKGLLITILIALLIIVIILFACLKVASDYDDASGYDD